MVTAMSHVEQFEHNPGDHDDPKGDSTWVIGLAGTIVLIVLVIAITVLYYHTDASYVQERVVNEAPSEILDLRSKQNGHLLLSGTAPVLDAEGNPVVDEAGRPVTTTYIPINEAIDQIIAESKSAPRTP